MSRIVNAILAFLFAAFAVIAGWHLLGPGNNLAMAAAVPGAKSYAGTRAAPEFEPGLDWINTSGQPVTLAGLKGKVVLLDFWTYGCINCMHVIPDLKRLMKKYPRELVVVGVHSAKFANEGVTSQIAKIAQRYERDEPIVNDHRMQVWDAWGARAWPTLALVDPAGKAVGTVAGEGHYDLLDTIIGRLITEFDAKGQIDRSPLPFKPTPRAKTTLAFPGKLLADAAGQRLFISDSNHDRIIVATLAGEVTQVIGGKGRGMQDGPVATATFHQPQGLALAGRDTLFVADNLNNAVRRVDLAKGVVDTVAGTGEHRYMRGTELAARGTPLNSPWDLWWHDGWLYVAMAGQHQLWRIDPKADVLERWAGSGYEALEDGARLAAGMNQPSGLSSDGKYLYIADSEASAIRRMGFDADTELETLVGTGLFDFGDKDGTGREVRLQHALGVAAHGGLVYLVDTYNSKLKVLDPRTRRVTTVVGGKGEFDEPGGLSIAAGKVFIADTNHHAVKVWDLATRKLTTLELKDPRRLL
jgi:thiol-disulfide isomerase/thioredoxin